LNLIFTKKQRIVDNITSGLSVVGGLGLSYIGYISNSYVLIGFGIFLIGINLFLMIDRNND